MGRPRGSSTRPNLLMQFNVTGQPNIVNPAQPQQPGGQQQNNIANSMQMPVNFLGSGNAPLNVQLSNTQVLADGMNRLERVMDRLVNTIQNLSQGGGGGGRGIVGGGGGGGLGTYGSGAQSSAGLLGQLRRSNIEFGTGVQRLASEFYSVNRASFENELAQMNVKTQFQEQARAGDFARAQFRMKNQTSILKAEQEGRDLGSVLGLVGGVALAAGSVALTGGGSLALIGGMFAGGAGGYGFGAMVGADVNSRDAKLAAERKTAYYEKQARKMDNFGLASTAQAIGLIGGQAGQAMGNMYNAGMSQLSPTVAMERQLLQITGRSGTRPMNLDEVPVISKTDKFIDRTVGLNAKNYLLEGLDSNLFAQYGKTGSDFLQSVAAYQKGSGRVGFNPLQTSFQERLAFGAFKDRQNIQSNVSSILDRELLGFSAGFQGQMKGINTRSDLGGNRLNLDFVAYGDARGLGEEPTQAFAQAMLSMSSGLASKGILGQGKNLLGRIGAIESMTYKGERLRGAQAAGLQSNLLGVSGKFKAPFDFTGEVEALTQFFALQEGGGDFIKTQEAMEKYRARPEEIYQQAQKQGIYGPMIDQVFGSTEFGVMGAKSLSIKGKQPGGTSAKKMAEKAEAAKKTQGELSKTEATAISELQKEGMSEGDVRTQLINLQKQEIDLHKNLITSFGQLKNALTEIVKKIKDNSASLVQTKATFESDARAYDTK